MDTDFILILDFGGQQAQRMARKLRGERYFCEIVPGETPAAKLAARGPKGLVLAGGTGDPGAPDARSVDADVFTLGLPVLAMGYGARQMALTLGGQLLGTQLTDRSAQISFADSPLFEGLGESERFFSRVDSLELPEGFGAIAFSDGGLVPAFACEERKLYALQFYAEANDPDGLQILANFAGNICGCEPWWSMEAFLERAEARIRKDIGGGSALIAISGGVDSAVCATLLHRAIGDRLKCVFIDTGLMRKGEPALVTSTFREALGMELTCIDASERILARLEGVCSPAAKREVVEREVMAVFEEEARAAQGVDSLALGTIYPDVLSGAARRTAGFEKCVEPLRLLFKDEVRQLGDVLGMPAELTRRQPFPEPGLALRIVGEVTREKLDMVRQADAIFREEVVAAGLDRRIWQYFAVLTDIRTLGPRNGRVCEEYAVALRAVSSHDVLSFNAYRLPYDLLERVCQRVTAEVPGVNRVLYDVTGMPTAFIEWE
ncbi:MAG TPA: glutamine-hydrolyzing GMP synthase [Candidatus Pullichristensenella stercoripullorum]|nr:glutamine-hydrolyzing GMP synthase [Candidatus Pullichristensenella stercoripullorum]